MPDGTSDPLPAACKFLYWIFYGGFPGFHRGQAGLTGGPDLRGRTGESGLDLQFPRDFEPTHPLRNRRARSKAVVG